MQILFLCKGGGGNDNNGDGDDSRRLVSSLRSSHLSPFQTDQSESAAVCAPCPEGGICDGGRSLPRPQYGFFGPVRGGPLVETGVPGDGTDSLAFVQCVPLEACLGGDGSPCGERFCESLYISPIVFFLLLLFFL